MEQSDSMVFKKIDALAKDLARFAENPYQTKLNLDGVDTKTGEIRVA